MTIKSSGPLSLTDINTEFQLGTSIGVHHGVRWYLDNGNTGVFSNTTLSFSDFYGKRKNSPVSPGSTSYTPGTYTFTVPYYNTLVIDTWAGGGGGYSGGAAGFNTRAGDGQYAGGGGSYYTGTFISGTTGGNFGNGYVQITKIN